MTFSLEYYSKRAILLFNAIISFLLSFLPLSSHNSTALSRTPRLSSAKAIKDSLRVLTYGEIDDKCGCNEGEGQTGNGLTCAVCLNEFDRKDEVRELRYCRHVFHKGCLDQWLDHDENGTCPLCRAPLSGPPVPPPPTGPSWVVDRLIYLFADDMLLCTPACL